MEKLSYKVLLEAAAKNILFSKGNKEDGVFLDVNLFSGKILSNMIFPDLGNVGSLYISNIHFNNVIFSDRILHGININEALFSNCIFSNCNLRKASFSNVFFNNAVFEKCDLSKIHFSKCRISNSVYNGNFLHSAIISDTIISHSIFISEVPPLNDNNQEKNVIWTVKNPNYYTERK